MRVDEVVRLTSPVLPSQPVSWVRSERPLACSKQTATNGSASIPVPPFVSHEFLNVNLSLLLQASFDLLAAVADLFDSLLDLRLRDSFLFRLVPDLVILSSCDTGSILCAAPAGICHWEFLLLSYSS